MRKFCLKLTAALISVFCLWIIGCGDDDHGGEYIAQVSFQDADEDDMMTIDIARGVCDTQDLNMIDSDDLEDYTDVFADITLSVAAWGQGITITGYTLEYIPLISEDGNHNLVTPPALNNLVDRGANNLYIAPGESATFTITCLSSDQKEEYRNLIGWTFYQVDFDSDDPADGIDDSSNYFWAIDATVNPALSDLEVARYTIRIILHCRQDSGESEGIEIRRTVYFGNYNNC
jgi:hypothetical protein